MTRILWHFRRAYRSTTYRVYLGRRRMDLRVGRRSFAAESFLQSLDTPCAVFITAHNPCSRPAGARENRAAQDRLLKDLRGLGLAGLPGEGIGQGRRWQAEESLFVPGLTLDRARALGRKYRQNAILFLQPGRPVALILLR